ncbi:MAG TPA: caspase family protein, partial [Haliscomenobacter sp.]|nr:caspase family protein [Haliscomenobacter sp.]
MAKKKLYALLVGIDAYAPPVRPLRGCLNDMHAFRDYLKKQASPDFEVLLKVIENEKATKAKVISGFDHFKKATKDDICVFYFSGHGTRIPSQDFWEAIDGMNEAIVCHDVCLADKELACLIARATQNKEVHFLAVMDCCHAGGNTRDDEDVTSRTSKPNRYPVSIQEYYGFKENLYQKNSSGLYSAPQGKHLNFAACRNYQTAKETMIGNKTRGAFTSSLIEALDTTQIPLTYADLESRVGRKIDNIVANQRPQLIATAEANLDLAFLGGAVVPKNRFFAYWNNERNSWEVNAGSYQGITNDQYPSKINGVENGQELLVKEIFTERTRVVWKNPAFRPDQNLQYDVQVKIGGGAKRMVAFASKSNTRAKALLMVGFEEANTTYLQLSNKIGEANWLIHASTESVYLTQLGNAEPVFLPVVYNKEPSPIETLEFWKKVDNVMQWYHLLHLDNPRSSIKLKDIRLDLFRSTGKKNWWAVAPEEMDSIADWSQPVVYDYQADQNG